MPDKLTKENIQNRLTARLEILQKLEETGAILPASQPSNSNIIENQSLPKRVRHQIVVNLLPKLGLSTYPSLRRAYTSLHQAARENETLRGQMNVLLNERDDLKANVKTLEAQLAARHETNPNQSSDENGRKQADNQPDVAQQFSLPSFVTDSVQNEKLDQVSSFRTLGDEGDALYLAIEHVLRGSIEQIKERQRFYIPHLPLPHNGLPVLDVGCGHGEFLSLLHEQNIPAVGIEINTIVLEDLRQKGFDVYLADAVKYLESLADNSLGGLTAFQVIEHMPKDYLRHFLKLAWRKLAVGSFVLLETVNPYCLNTYRTYYHDDTHENPVPSDLLSVLMAFYGFKNLQIFYQSPVTLNEQPAEQEWAFYYLDYALMGIKRPLEASPS